MLFDLLRERSRQEGRKNRQRGIEVAELALVSLERSDSVFGERIHDLRAFAWAWLGNAHRLALDFSAAEAAFEQADRRWFHPRAERDLFVLAHIHNLKGTLRAMQRDFAAGTRDLDCSCSLFRQLGQARGEAIALVQRAAIHIYAGKLSEAVEDLREAAGLIDEDQESELAFAVRGNLANAMARAGEIRSAVKELDHARRLNESIHDPLGTPKLDWIDGYIRERHGDVETARQFYLSARAGFDDANEPRYFALVSVDLMIVHSLQDDWEGVGELASKTLPILGSLEVHSETLTAVNILVQALEAKNLSRRLLAKLRAALRRDPLTL